MPTASGVSAVAMKSSLSAPYGLASAAMIDTRLLLKKAIREGGDDGKSRLSGRLHFVKVAGGEAKIKRFTASSEAGRSRSQ
jgi:hypothetical protein